MALFYLGGEAAQIELGLPQRGDRHLPGHAAVLPARLRLPDPLPPALVAAPRRGRAAATGMSASVGSSSAILRRSSARSTPLLLAATRRARGREVRRAQSRRRGHDAGRRGRRLRRRPSAPAAPSLGIAGGGAGGRGAGADLRVLTLTLAGQPGGDRPRADHLRRRPLGARRRAAIVGTPLPPLPRARSAGAERPAGRSARSCSARTRWSMLVRRAGRRGRLVPLPHARRAGPARGRRDRTMPRMRSAIR